MWDIDNHRPVDFLVDKITEVIFNMLVRIDNGN